MAFIDRRRPQGALHCTPGTETLCGGVHRSSAIPWRASFYAGGAGVLHRGAKTLAFWWGSDASGFYNLGPATHYGLGPATHEPLRAPSHLLGVKDQAFPSRAKT